MILAIAYPVLDPVAFELGPLSIRWYSLAYVVGLLGGAALAQQLLARLDLWPGRQPPFEPRRAWDVMGAVAIGVVLGGRLGYVFFYAPGAYLADPLRILALWEGGMSFHGGFLGAVTAAWLASRTWQAPPLSVADILACTAPLGILLGRISNFVNGELWGRVSDVPWAMVFPAPSAGDLPRHPSQLYEAALEGLLPLVLLNLLAVRGKAFRRPGLLAGCFAAGYAAARIFVERFREPDPGLGFLLPVGGGGVTMGMLLSMPLLLAGAGLVLHALRKPARH